MSNIKIIEKKWIENFKNSPLVDGSTGLFKSDYAHILFYGKEGNGLYPPGFPYDFKNYYATYTNLDIQNAIETCNVFLNFIGIKLDNIKVFEHIRKNPAEYKKYIDKCYYIIKTLAHYSQTMVLSNPYKDNFREIEYLLRIECDEIQLTIFDEPLFLPDLYSRFKNFPEGYEKNEIVKQLFERIENTNESFYITGKAGTGKSTFIQYFAKRTRKKVLLCAFTGIAAINVGGQTIHSFFRFKPQPLLPEDDEITIFEKYSKKYNRIRRLNITSILSIM